VDDEIGGSCPRRDGEFRPGTTVCPDCGIPLVGVREATEDAPPAPPPAWLDRLWPVAAACAASVLLTLAGAAVNAFAAEAERFGGVDLHRRLALFASVAHPTVGVVALVGGAAAAVTASRRRAVRRLVFVAGSLVALTAIVGGYETWRADVGSTANAVYSYATWASTLALGLVAAAVADVLPGPGTSE
jgi:hypothetical protein